MSWLLRVLLSFTGLLVSPFTSLVDKSKRCVQQLCAKGARTRYNDWGDGEQGVEVAGEWANARAAVRGVRAMSCAIEANGVGSKGKMRRRSGKLLVRGLL